MADLLDRVKTALSDRYRIERELGSGGMAIVYLAEDVKLERLVAVKVVRPELAASLGDERFLREVKITAKLEHPHILTLHDSGEAGGFLYYVMPYVEGESLRERLDREKQLPLIDALQIAREIADALSYAHSHDVIHRDIKPENVLLASGHAVVSDFGIARAISAAGGDRLTETGLAIGTPSYMSPEQAAGEKVLDGRSDLYSLACVLYEMLAGEPPFTGPTVESIVHQHLTVEPRAITAIRPVVPAEVAAALSRALSKTPADRFSPVGQFAEVLGSATGASMVPAATTARRPRRWAPVAASAIAVIAAAIVVLLRGMGSGADEFNEVARRDWIIVAEFDGSADSAILHMARELVSTALDQSSIVMTVPWADIQQGLELAGRPDTVRLDAMLAQELAVRSTVRPVLTGQIDRVGNTFSILLRVIDADSGVVMLAERAIAEGEDDLIPTVDRAVRNLRERLGERRNAIRANRQLVEVITPSLAAYRKFLAATELIGATRYSAAIETLREALAIDPEFASARLSMAAPFLNRGLPDSAAVAAADALAKLDRLTAAERLRAEAMAAFAVWDLPRAVAAYRELALRHQAGHMNLGVLLNQLGRTEEALEMYRQEPHPFGPNQVNLWNQSEALFELGRHEEAWDVVQQFGDARKDEREYAFYIVTEQWSAAESLMVEVERARPPTDRGSQLWWRVAHGSLDAVRGSVASADSALLRMIEFQTEQQNSESVRLYEETRLILDLAVGRANEASHLTDSDTALVFVIHRALCAALSGDTEQASALLATIESVPEHERAWHGSAPLVIEAAIAAVEGRWENVRATLGWTGSWYWPHNTFRGVRLGVVARLLLAEAYERVGNLDSAAAYFELLGKPGRFVEIDQYNRATYAYPFAHFRLGRLYSQIGNAARASDEWLLFLDTFTTPDPEFEWMVEEARGELARLARER